MPPIASIEEAMLALISVIRLLARLLLCCRLLLAGDLVVRLGRHV